MFCSKCRNNCNGNPFCAKCGNKVENKQVLSQAELDIMQSEAFKEWHRVFGPMLINDSNEIALLAFKEHQESERISPLIGALRRGGNKEENLHKFLDNIKKEISNRTKNMEQVIEMLIKGIIGADAVLKVEYNLFYPLRVAYKTREIKCSESKITIHSRFHAHFHA